MVEIADGKRVFVHTFGCQMNVHDTERMLGLLSMHGYTPVEDAQEADVVLLNTCSVREKPEHKVLSAVGRYGRLRLGDRRPLIAVGGCFGRQKGEELLGQTGFVDLVFGPDNIPELPELLARVRRERGGVSEVEFDGPGETRFLDVTPHPVTSPVTGLVTIIKGCDKFCSFCIVPHVRGREKSRSPESIVGEVERLVSGGVRDVTLLGQSVTSYRYRESGGDVRLSRLLELVAQVDGLHRLRFTSPYPRDFSADLIDCFSRIPELCEHVHLPVQSGSDRVLSRMNRRHTRDEYFGWVDSLRQRVPRIAITTDLIVGFPGETDQDFRDTMDLVRRVRFDGFFSFKYSERPGTRAVVWGDDVPEDVKQRRLEILQSYQRDVTREASRALEGTEVEVLIEGSSRKNSSQVTGRTRCNRVAHLPGGSELVGRLVRAEVSQGYQNSLSCTLVDRG